MKTFVYLHVRQHAKTKREMGLSFKKYLTEI